MSADGRAAPCPFCGGASELFPTPGPRHEVVVGQVRCLSLACGAWGPTGPPDEALEGWRSPAAFRREARAQLDSELDDLHERISLLEQARDCGRGFEG